jgi:hypothetical protein
MHSEFDISYDSPPQHSLSDLQINGEPYKGKMLSASNTSGKLNTNTYDVDKQDNINNKKERKNELNSIITKVTNTDTSNLIIKIPNTKNENDNELYNNPIYNNDIYNNPYYYPLYPIYPSDYNSSSSVIENNQKNYYKKKKLNIIKIINIVINIIIMIIIVIIIMMIEETIYLILHMNTTIEIIILLHHIKKESMKKILINIGLPNLK